MENPIVASLTIKRHSRMPYLRLLIKDKNGDPFPLTGAASVVFLMYSSGSTEKVNSPAILEDIPNGILRYEWAAEDVDTEGEYHAEFDITYDNGAKMTVPKDGVLLITVFEDLDNS
jgi:hypothetical protein